MCYIIHQYACGHEYTIKVRQTSKEAYEACLSTTNLRQFPASPPKQNILSKLFRSASSSQAQAPREKKPRYLPVDQICENCEKDERLKQPPRKAPWDLAGVRAQQMEKAKKAIQEGKQYFMCSKCTREGIPLVYGAQRAANNGLCCDNGRKSWAELEEIVRSGRSSKVPGDHSPSGRANSQPVRSSAATTAARKAGDERRTRDKALPSLPAKRERGEVKAVTFNPERAGIRPNNREPVHLQPRHTGVPGITHPTQTTEQGTYYQVPGIEFDRWANHPRTNHGLLPTAPRKPLPPPPPAQPDKRGRDLTSHRKPVPQPQPQTPPRTQARDFAPGAPARGPREERQPTRSQTSQQTSTRHEQQPTRSQSSRETPTRHTYRHGSTRPPRPRPELVALAQLSTEPQSLSTPPHPLRSTRGKEWRDSADLANRSPATADAPSMTHSHRSTRRSNQSVQRESQDIASIPLTSISTRRSPVRSKRSRRRDSFDWAMTAPFSLGRELRTTPSHFNQHPQREDQESSRSHRLTIPFQSPAPLAPQDPRSHYHRLTSPFNQPHPIQQPLPIFTQFISSPSSSSPVTSQSQDDFPIRSARVAPLSAGRQRAQAFLAETGQRAETPEIDRATEYWESELRGRPRECRH